MERKNIKIVSIMVLVGIIFGTFSNTSAVTITKNPTKNSVKIPIKIYGSDNIDSFTIIVSKSQKKELDTFIDSLKEKLENAENNADKTTTIVDAIETLDNMGFISNSFNGEQLQGQIIENVQFNNQVVYNENSQEFNNYFCFVIGQFSEMYTPLELGTIGFWVAFGWYYAYGGPGWYPADGWIYTCGLNGSWSYEGRFIGTAGVFNIARNEWYIGAGGFLGIKIGDFLIGSAAIVGIETVV